MPALAPSKDPVVLAVEVEEDLLTVHLADGRVLATPLAWYPRLLDATEEERSRFEIVGQGSGIHWPELDEDLSIEGMLAGQPSAEGAASLKSWRERLARRRAARARAEEPEPWTPEVPLPDWWDTGDDE